MLSTIRRIRIARHFHSRTASTYSPPFSPNHSIYVSNSHDPYFNLSLEDWLFRHKSPKDPLLLLYRDRPCVVIGRNQNPWKEVNMRALRKSGIPFIRRRSGGGAVYHDLGNTNYSIHLPRTSFSRHATAQVVLAALRSLGIDANVNERNDICVGTNKIGLLLVPPRDSILMDTGVLTSLDPPTRLLDLLGDILRANKDTIDTKGVVSVRSPVCNLRQYDANLDHSSFVDALVKAFCQEYGINEEIQVIDEDAEVAGSIEYIRHGMAELPSWDWAYGQTPEFTQVTQGSFGWGDVTASIHSRHGVILHCEFTTSESELQQRLDGMAGRLQHQRYGFLSNSILQLDDVDERLRDVSQWLKAETDC